MGVYIKGRLVSVVSYDSDASAFITAANIVDTYQKNAINQLVVNLKAAGIWSKMKAVYPFVGGTAFSHKFNLKNPLDTNAAFRLVFSGGWTHSSTGAKPNGTNAYADTFLSPNTSLSLNSSHASYYSRTNSNNTEVEVGSSTGNNATDNKIILEIRTSGITYYNVNAQSLYISHADSDSRAFYLANRTASNVINGWRNSSKLATGTVASTGLSIAKIYLGALNQTISTVYYSIKECAFASIGDGLTDTEALVFNQIVEGYQYALSRNVNPVNANYYNPAYNNETNAFLYASEITDNTQKSAVNTLVNDLQTAGIWTKMKAIYPMVGGTATTHKYNLKDPQDTNAAFRLSFIGGWTHSANGATPNGTNGYANTFLFPNTSLTISSAHFAKYNRNNDLVGNKVDGTLDNFNIQFVQQNYSAGNGIIGSISSTASYTPTDTRGLFTLTRTSSNLVKVFRNNTQIASNTTFISALPINTSIFIGARNDGSPVLYNSYEAAFASIGDGLTDTEAANFYTVVQAYQLALNRNV